ncbi:MAG: class I SAM-dependent methyltransferase [Desulfobaccales bacterium]|nr:class I SAM-dependent methyltransferase [Desulfobaccales bacterium]
MKLSALFSFLRRGRLQLIWRLSRLLNSVYRAGFLSAAASHGVLRRLAAGPVSFDCLAAELASDPASQEALAAWLQVGVRLGELQLGKDGYSLRGKLAKAMAAEKNDAEAAFLEEAMGLHYALLTRLPELLAQKRRFTLADQDGELIARSSRLLEPLVFDAINAVVPRSGPLNLLEVGCGSGTYIRYAAARNPGLKALGVEMQPQVAAWASRNLKTWRLEDRAAVEVGDIRHRAAEPVFDVVTLHNNIYYFPVDLRVEVLAHLRKFLKSGGRLLITTGCQGGSPIMALLNLWGAATEGCGRLPAPEEMLGQLRQAGFTSVKATRLYPFDSYYAFVGTG